MEIGTKVGGGGGKEGFQPHVCLCHINMMEVAAPDLLHVYLWYSWENAA